MTSLPPPWHALAAAEVLVRLDSGAAGGLTAVAAARRLETLGPNALPEPKRRSWLGVVAAQLKSPLIYLLLIAAAIALALGERGDAAVILVVLTANTAVGAFQEGRAERSMRALRQLSLAQARVMRDGAEQLLAAREVVPGDVILLAVGEAVPADARVLEEVALELSEASLTGESLPVRKSADAVAADVELPDRRSMVYAGTHVTAGRGRAVAVATGLGNEVGKIAALTEAAAEPKTPLERKLERFGRVLALAAVGLFALVLATGLLRGVPLSEISLVAISQLVSVVPEGLPVAMTVALAVGMRRMASRKAIVRRLAAVETLGSTTVICTDKTGTLTRNEMTVTAVALPSGERLEVSGAGYAPVGVFRRGGAEVAPEALSGLVPLAEAAALCNDAQLVEAAEGWQGLGDPTEIALVTFARKAGLSTSALRAQRSRSGELPFSSEEKRMATAHGSVVFIKGAPEAVFELCRSGEPVERAREEAESLARDALRVLAFARVELREGEALAWPGLKGRAALLGLVGQLDPPREEVRAAISSCRDAGIRTVMITGDHRETAAAIAVSLGLSREGDHVLDGRALEALEPEALRREVGRVSVFARVQPAQKLRIVEALQAEGEVVAMTGDGVNDAPALARAEVGVAMGLTGTAPAKEAAKLILTDDNFATLVAAVEEGRVVYRNLKKVVLLLLSTGAAEVAVLVGCLVTGLPLPFHAVQILWNNVVTEGTVTLNLVLEPREGDEMRRPPIPLDEPILTRSMLGRLAGMSAAIAACSLGYFAYRLSQGTPLEHARTATFTLLAVCEWFNLLNCRSELKSAFGLDLLSNRALVAGLLLSNVLQLMVVYAPFCNRIFHTVPIPLGEALGIGVVGSAVLWVEEARKAWARSRLRRR